MEVAAFVVVKGLVWAKSVVKIAVEVLVIDVQADVLIGASAGVVIDALRDLVLEVLTNVISSVLTSVMIDVGVDMLTDVGIFVLLVLVLVLKFDVLEPYSTDMLFDTVVGVSMYAVAGMLAGVVTGVALGFGVVLVAVNVLVA